MRAGPLEARRPPPRRTPRVSLPVRFSPLQHRGIPFDAFTPMRSWSDSSNLDVGCGRAGIKPLNSRSEISLAFLPRGVRPRQLRVRVSPKSTAFEAHRDEFGCRGAVVLDLPLARCPAFATGELDSLDVVAHLARRDPDAAAALLLEEIRPTDAALEDWPDALGEELPPVAPAGRSGPRGVSRRSPSSGRGR